MTRAELNNLTVAELRREGRQRGVVGASRMRKEDLVATLAELLGLEPEYQDPQRAALESRTVMALRREALDRGVRGAARMDKATLVDLLSQQSAGEVPAGESSAVTEAPAPRPAGPADLSFRFPDSYGVDRVVLLVRDPEWLYSYWDISGDTWASLIQRGITHPGKGWKRALRLYDYTGALGSSNPADCHVADIVVDDLAREWYFRAPLPDRVYVVEFGYLSPDGEFIVIARSNSVQVPRPQPSNIVDEQWGTLYDEAFRLSLAGADPTRVQGSVEAAKRLESLLEEGISSGHFGASQPWATSGR
ncbi:MAG: DUF4912 domain-containing protein [Armatimonadetes bacterium]|nr:DUF4912 domain-containing protein [Armatimonadota bacterium]